jgi:hypothetical protein
MTPKRAACGVLLGAGLLFGAGQAQAQGCALCRDNTASTSPATQRAFRHSIEFMIAAAGSFFAASVLVIRRHR